MLLIKSFIENMSADISLDDFCVGITRGINDIYHLHNIDIRNMEEHPENRLTASAIIYSRYRDEIWMVGDCQCMVDGKLHTNDKPYEARIAKQRADAIKKGTSPDKARAMIIPGLIEAMKEGQNKTYAVIDGFPIYREGIRVISLSKENHEIVLASDGYPFLKKTLSESEQALSDHLEKDPQNTDEFPATKGLVADNKSFDDRSYIRIIL